MRGLFGSIARPRRSEPQDVAFSESFWRELGVGVGTSAGESVSWKSALEVTTALRCGLVIADGVATVPCKLMRKDPATGRRREADDHPLSEILSLQVNTWQDPLQFFETKTLHTVFTGDGYSFINRVRGRIFELIPLKPECVRVEQETNYKLRYWVAGLDGVEQEFPAETIWHVRGPSWNGYKGLDTIRLAREALGLAMATEKAHAKRFGNGIQATGVYSVEGSLEGPQYERLRAWIDQNHVGAQNSGKPFLLDRNAKWTPMGMTGVDSEHVKTREMQIQEICRAFGVMPLMVGFSDKTATYASAEQMFLAHAVHTVRPWHRRFEKSMKRSLLTREEVRAGYYFRFLDTELLRGAAKDRADYYSKMFAVGALSPNRILELEDEDGFEGGDTHFVPANMMDAANPAAASAAADGEGASDGAAGMLAKHGARPLNVGRVLSADNEGKIRDARDKLDTVLAKLDSQEET